MAENICKNPGNSDLPPVYIAGTGSYVPEKILSNYDLENILETSHDWIVKRTGISERRIAAGDQTTADLAAEAGWKALEAAGMSIEDIGLIVVATITPDTQCPSAANWVQAKMDAPHALSFDVTAACSGYLFALNVAEQYLKTGFCSSVLVIASEVMSRTLDWTDRTTCILWGDGAGAAVLTTRETPHRLLSTHVHTDGASGKNLLLPGGGSSTTPISHESVDKKLHTLKMIEASASVRVAVKHFSDSCFEAVDFNGVSIDEVDWVIPHQANLRMLQSVGKKIGVGMERFYLTLQKYGNISSASAAIALDEAIRTGSVKPENLVLLTAFGGGLTWGSALIKW